MAALKGMHYADVLVWRFQILFPVYEAGIMYVSGHNVSSTASGLMLIYLA